MTSAHRSDQPTARTAIHPTGDVPIPAGWRARRGGQDEPDLRLQTDHGRTATATMFFDTQGRLTDFVAQRYRTADGGDPETWSTPVTGYGEFEGLRLPTRGKAIWKLPSGDLEYIDVTITDLRYHTRSKPPGDSGRERRGGITIWSSAPGTANHSRPVTFGERSARSPRRAAWGRTGPRASYGTPGVDHERQRRPHRKDRRPRRPQSDDRHPDRPPAPTQACD